MQWLHSKNNDSERSFGVIYYIRYIDINIRKHKKNLAVFRNFSCRVKKTIEKIDNYTEARLRIVFFECNYCIQIKYNNNTLSSPRTEGTMDKLPPPLTYPTPADLSVFYSVNKFLTRKSAQIFTNGTFSFSKLEIYFQFAKNLLNLLNLHL